MGSELRATAGLRSQKLLRGTNILLVPVFMWALVLVKKKKKYSKYQPYPLNHVT